jgi:hypothetical protein
MVKTLKISILCVLFAVPAMMAEPAVKKKSTITLREGFLIDYVQGVMSIDANGKWVFKADTKLFDGLKTLKAQSPVELLPSSTLEKITTGIDPKKLPVKNIHLRLQAAVTKYKDKNYLFATSYIPLSKGEKPTPVPAAEKEKEIPEQAEETKDDPILSDDVKEMLKPTWTPDLGQKKRRDEIKVEDDFSLVGRTGFVIDKNKRKYFRLDGLGRKIDRNAYKILRCSSLEFVEKVKYRIPGRRRYSISGIITTYKGQKYLLPQRVARTYNHGNFAR